MSQTVRRALSIIEFFADEPRSLGQVADHLGVHKSTALRLLQTLEAARFARQGPDGRYTIGFDMIALAQRGLDELDLFAIAHPHLTRLGEQYGHTLHVAQLVGDEIVYIDKVDGRGALKMHSRVGEPVCLHTSGVAKAILAGVDEATSRRVLAHATYQRFTTTTRTSPRALLADLAATRDRGWAEDDGEYEDFVACVAVAIRDHTGAVRASVSITALTALASLDVLRTDVPRLRSVAEAISHDWGCTS